MTLKIDTHAHWFPPEWVDLIAREGNGKGVEVTVEGGKITRFNAPGKETLSVAPEAWRRGDLSGRGRRGAIALRLRFPEMSERHIRRLLACEPATTNYRPSPGRIAR